MYSICYLILVQQDPYVVMTVGPTVQRTDVHQKGGKTPKWEGDYSFVSTGAALIRFRVMDKDKMYVNIDGWHIITITLELLMT